MKKSFRARLIQVVLMSVIGVSLIVILFTTMNYLLTHVENERRMAKKQIEIIQNALEQELESLYQLGNMMKNDGTIQAYMEDDSKIKDGSFLNEVSMELVNYKKLNPNIKTVALVRYSDGSINYVGNAWQANREELFNNLRNDYLQATVIENKTDRISMNQSIFKDGARVLNLFFPVFHSYSVYNQLGFICVSVSENVIQSYYEGEFFDNILLVNEGGEILSHLNSDLVETDYEKSEILAMKVEEKYDRGAYYYVGKIGSSGWFLLAEISLYRIMKSAAEVLLVSIIVMCLMCASLVIFCYKAAQKLIHPVEDLKERMGAVSQGDMSIRMDGEYRETEFSEMAKSFNVMVKNVDQLMERIKEEQIQMQKIQLSALQEQIKPHFLYNTLECIHMQAVIDGNEEISKLVLALASYYRLCLGKGKDIIPLKQELAHIENYLVIQNVRYGNIIQFEKNIPEQFELLPILKMTLQPLVENCIYHGIKVKEGRKGKIYISIRCEDNVAILSVEDDGIGMTNEQITELNKAIQIFDEQKGYGVRNVNRRIRIFFGEQYGLTYYRNEKQGVTVEIRIPYNL